MNDDATIGDRIAHLRRSQGLTQAQLAERAGLSIDVVKKLEQNIRLSARGSTLSALARVLKARTSDLMGDASGAAARAEPDHRPLSLMRLRRVLTPARGYGGQPAAIHAPPALTDVTAQLQAIDRAYHRDDYATVLGALPSLITGARAAAAAANEADRVAAYAALARAYHLAGNLLIQVRAGDLAHWSLAAALDAAQQAGDPIVGGTVVQGMTWLMLRQGRLDDAEQIATETADTIEPPIRRARPDELAAWGWLLLGAAAAAARDNRADDALEMIDTAAAAAARIGDRLAGDRRGHLIMVTGFNPARVEMQRAETAAVSGDAGRVLDLASRVPMPESDDASSWNRHRLDVAWAYAALGRTRDATDVLSEVRHRAPAWLRHQRYARDIVSTLITTRRRAATAELSDLAALVGAGQ